MSDTEKKKLCFVIPSLQAGGMERVMSELLRYFSSKNGIELHVILYGITREIFYPVPDTIIIHKPAFRFNNRLRLFHAIKTLGYLRRIIKRINPYTVLSFGEYWNSYLLLALFGMKIQVFVSDRCQPDKSLGVFHDKLRKALYPKASGIIVQTQTAKTIYNQNVLNSNILVIGNPIRTIRDRNIPKENIVLSVGRLIKSKNHDKLIEIFLKISKPGWKLVIIGYDHLKQNQSNLLKEIIQNYQAENSVILTDKQRDVEKFYLQSRIFAFTSSSEGFPNVIGEAMSAGLPVVAFDCIAGPSEMIQDNKNGYLVPMFDNELFRQKLELLMDNDVLRNEFGENAREDILKFSVTAVGEEYFRVLTMSRN